MDGDEAERDRHDRQHEVRLDQRRVKIAAHGDTADDAIREHR